MALASFLRIYTSHHLGSVRKALLCVKSTLQCVQTKKGGLAQQGALHTCLPVIPWQITFVSLFTQTAGCAEEEENRSVCWFGFKAQLNFCEKADGFSADFENRCNISCWRNLGSQMS